MCKNYDIISFFIATILKSGLLVRVVALLLLYYINEHVAFYPMDVHVCLNLRSSHPLQHPLLLHILRLTPSLFYFSPFQHFHFNQCLLFFQPQFLPNLRIDL
jgi:hypothetical protein